ncbi:DUF2846 domain-containing protein [Oxalobacteraceae bacterium]|nr:DUF2846 domain-containing protein [Oxalobacteraceae bacterium]
MTFFAHIAKVAAITSIVVLSGCASVNKAPANVDAESKLFKANPTASQVYLYRNETLGAALSMPVTVDGQLAGNTGAHTFFKFDLPAGEHKFTSQGNESLLTLSTVIGGQYFVWQEVKMGVMSGGSKLQVVPAEQGKKGVLESTQIQSELK